jgi:PAS domain S-box-containing protein
MTKGTQSRGPDEGLLLDLLQGFDGMMWEATPQAGSLTFIGSELQNSLGYPPERFLDKPMFWLDIVHPEDRGKIFAVIEQALRSGEVSVFEHRVRCAGGAWIWLRNVLRVAAGEDGKVARLFGLAFDISGHKGVEAEVEDARRRAAFLAEASRILASSLDYETTLKNVARVAVPSFADWCTARLLTPEGDFRELAVVHVDPDKEALVQRMMQRYPPSPQDPHGPGKVLSSGKPEFLSEATQRLSSQWINDPEHLELLRQIGMRSYICVPMTARGQVLGTMNWVLSESDRRYTRADLALARDLAARAAMAIENARFYQEAREEVRRREAFLAVLGHELRNPLGAISNAVRVLQAVDHDDPRAAAQRNILDRQTNQLSRLVDDLLDVSRMLSGKIRLMRHRLNLSQEVERCLQTFCGNQGVSERRIEISLQRPDLFIDADEVRLEQIILNLLNNALKFTAPGGRIWVEVAQEGAQAVIRVRDDGVGIPAEQLPHIFDAFRQGPETLTEAAEGFGIGLALVRRLAELHDGSAHASSAGAGRGSEFAIRLPLSEQAAETRPEPPARSTNVGRRILIVDDDRDSLDSLQALLELMGHQVMGAREGGVALEAAQSWRPDVALVDIGLPAMDGYEICRKLRAMGHEPRPVLIALTGYGQPEDRRRALEAGFDHHLTKPIDLDRLRQLLATGSAGEPAGLSPSRSC